MGPEIDTESLDWSTEQTRTINATPPAWAWEDCLDDIFAVFLNGDPALEQIDDDEYEDIKHGAWLEWADTAVDYLKERRCFVPRELLLEVLGRNCPRDSWLSWWDLERTILFARTLLDELVAAGQVVETTVSDVTEKGCWCEQLPEWRRRDWRLRNDCWCIRNHGSDRVPVVGLPYVVEC